MNQYLERTLNDFNIPTIFNGKEATDIEAVEYPGMSHKRIIYVEYGEGQPYQTFIRRWNG